MLVGVAPNCFINPLNVATIRKDEEIRKVVVETCSGEKTFLAPYGKTTLDDTFEFTVKSINDELRRLEK